MASAFPLHELETLVEACLEVESAIDEPPGPEPAIREITELGEEILAVENAHITMIEPHVDYWEALYSTDQVDGIVHTGQSLALGTTYCRKVIQRDETVAFSHAKEMGWADDPAYREHELECYLGSPIYVNDELFGTVCFVKREPREQSFTGDEMRFAEHIAFELGRIIERLRLESQTQRLTELNSVLQRILRHNLRNELTVITGRASLLASEVPSELDRHVDPMLSHLDSLQELIEKSQNIDEIFSHGLEEEQTSLDDLLSTIVSDVQRDAPDATFETDLSDVSLRVPITVKRALTELVENAAKHGGDPPQVAVLTEVRETDVRIEIVDNGAGLPESERRIFEGETETALNHGSGLGLWLATWSIAKHNGSIEASETDTGTRISVTLPYTSTVVERPG